MEMSHIMGRAGPDLPVPLFGGDYVPLWLQDPESWWGSGIMVGSNLMGGGGRDRPLPLFVAGRDLSLPLFGADYVPLWL